MVGVDGPGVMVPGRIAAWLERRAGLPELRASMRGIDNELDSVLVAMALAAAAWRSRSATASDHGTDQDKHRLLPSGSALTATEAAALLGISARAVRLAITAGRLDAWLSGGVWLIDRQDLEQFRATRNGDLE